MKIFAAPLVLGILWLAPHVAHADMSCEAYRSSSGVVQGLWLCSESITLVPPYNWTASDGGMFVTADPSYPMPKADYVLFQCANRGTVAPPGAPAVVKVTITVTMPAAPFGGHSDTATVDCKYMTDAQAAAWANELAVLYMTMIYAQELAAMGQNGCLAFQVSPICGFNIYDWNSIQDYYWLSFAVGW